MVELIVVLVILAILAAIMVPALLGWIDKARDKQIVIDARSAYLAAQTLASEEYGAKNHGTTPANVDDTAIQNLAGVTGTSSITWDGFKVKEFTYSDGSKNATLSSTTGQWDVTPVTGP